MIVIKDDNLNSNNDISNIIMNKDNDSIPINL